MYLVLHLYLQVLKSPRVSPLIIHLDEDSSSDEEIEETATSTADLTKGSSLPGLDSMLKECRQASTVATQKVQRTPFLISSDSFLWTLHPSFSD